MKTAMEANASWSDESPSTMGVSRTAGGTAKRDGSAGGLGGGGGRFMAWLAGVEAGWGGGGGMY